MVTIGRSTSESTCPGALLGKVKGVLSNRLIKTHFSVSQVVDRNDDTKVLDEILC